MHCVETPRARDVVLIIYCLGQIYQFDSPASSFLRANIAWSAGGVVVDLRPNMTEVLRVAGRGVR